MPTGAATKLRALLPLLLALPFYAGVSLRYGRVREGEDALAAFARHLSQGMYGDAKGDIERAVSLSPGNAYIAACNALLYERMNKAGATAGLDPRRLVEPDEGQKANIRAAIDLYHKSLQLNPNDDCVAHNLGWLYLSLGRREEALEYLKRAVEIDGLVPVNRVSLGLLHELGGRKELAFKEYERAVMLSPGLLDSRFFAELRETSPAEAEQLVGDSIRFFEEELGRSRNTVTMGRLGKLYLHRGELDKAWDALRAVTAEHPGLSRPWLNLGDIYAARGDTEEASLCYRKASVLDPSDYQSLSRLGDIYYRQDRRREAIVYYEQALGRRSALASEHARRVRRLYRTRTYVPDDLVPDGLLAYCAPPLDERGLYVKLSVLYRVTGDAARARRFEEKARTLAGQ